MWGSIADTILPNNDDNKKPMIQAFEIATQIFFFYLALIYIPTFVSNFALDEPSSRYHDKLIVLVFLIGTQLNLLKKIDTLRENTIGVLLKTNVLTDEANNKNDSSEGATPIEDIINLSS